MGGTSKQTQSTQSQSAPWAPAVPELQGILGQIASGNLAPTSAQAAAATNAVNAANGIPNLGPTVANTVQGYFDPNFTNPYNNPALKNAFDALNQQIQTSTASRFSQAGRDPAGNVDASKAIALAEAMGEAPVLASEYNSLLGFQQSGVPLAGAVPSLYMQPSAAQMAAASQQAQLPLANALAAEQATIPIAGLGGQTSGSGTSYNTMSPAQTFATWMMPFYGGSNSSAAGFSKFMGF